MTNAEFSDAFTTLLNSYNTQAGFGEQASKRDIVLDEYEKSVLLTQAQDIVIKSYFDEALNNQKQGFDDSTRRQMDFSSLIKVEELTPTGDNSTCFDSRGIIFKLPRKKDRSGVEIANTTDVLFILNEKLTVSTGTVSAAYWYKEGQDPVVGAHTNTVAANLPYTGSASAYTTTDQAEAAGWRWVAPRNSGVKEYVIVPINYKEYDREMSKPFAQPLKKQAWRLFQNQATGFDIDTELIPKHSIVSGVSGTFVYKIRYVKRPKPIILEDMPNGLEIDGESLYSECELNPIIHMDILNKAVELAIATRGGAAAERGVPVNNNMMGQNN